MQAQDSRPIRTPEHIAIIMDGNGRWAKARNKPRIFGHRKGVKTVREVVRWCSEANISYLTLFAFSSENWCRPANEVNFLMELFVSTLENEIYSMHENGVKLKIVGDVSRFKPRLQTAIKKAQQLTQLNNKLVLSIAANYGGRWDIINATKKIADQVKQGQLAIEDINESTFASYLINPDIVYPDLFIRTGGEFRISNFLLWQLAYSELYFTQTFWPAFDEVEFKQALAVYAQRQRRFGLTGEQVQKS